MRLVSFKADGFRSLNDVVLDRLGPFAVFYGPNGSGKSNVLSAIRVFYRLLAEALQMSVETVEFGTKSLDDDDYSRRRVDGVVVLEGLIDLGPYTEPDNGPSGSSVLWAHFTVSRSTGMVTPLLRLEIGGHRLVHPSRSNLGSDWPLASKRVFAETVGISRCFHLVDAPRRIARDKEGVAEPAEGSDSLAQLRAGRLAKAFFLAKTGPDHRQRRRLEDLQKLLAGEPLRRPAFEAVRDPTTQTYELRERMSEPNPDGVELRLDLAGPGVGQLYSILAQAMLSDAQIVGVEEPEAHLHAPSSGRHLRELLKRLVESRYVDQLFITTHSNLFDLDDAGYWDFELDPGGNSSVRRRPLRDIDARHLYEPGPAKHALEDLLRYAPPEHVVFRRADGTPVTATDMLGLLQADDEIALEFLRAVHGAAVRVVRLEKPNNENA